MQKLKNYKTNLIIISKYLLFIKIIEIIESDNYYIVLFLFLLYNDYVRVVKTALMF